MPLQLDQEYADMMKNHPFGIALYQPLPQQLFHPGCCGYFDSFGQWNPIVELDDTESLKKLGLAPVDDELQKAPAETDIRWGPKISQRARAVKVGMSVEVDPMLATALPVSASAVYSFSTDTDSGAILLTIPPVVHDRYYYESPFKNWVKHNAVTLLKRRPEIKDYGLWIITSTYTTKKCAINLWKKSGKALKVAFSAKVVGIGECGPSGEWSKDQNEQGWSEFGSKDASDSRVVFFGGLKFQCNKLIGKTLKSRQVAPKQFRGHDPVDEDLSKEPEVISTIQTANGEDDEGYEITCEEYLEEIDGNDGEESW
ncbi:hypothetical protein BDQ12DRAFT_673333 [Crucibulum laeve]|uniref:Uncharacterized protein n=1 Tax=Crucibulum laeve TaxID=68775 RepID=A0A5C3MTD5_9AGAR|nr:hypothetical protein BDQ12DRAFT_673333 [Crucibulum laeve]